MLNTVTRFKVSLEDIKKCEMSGTWIKKINNVRIVFRNIELRSFRVGIHITLQKRKMNVMEKDLGTIVRHRVLRMMSFM